MNETTNTAPEQAILKVKGLQKHYAETKLVTPILHGIDMHLNECESLAIIGKSGSGKSTLLHLLGGLDEATGGIIDWFGSRFDQMSNDELSGFRNENMGFVYQFHHLLPEFTLLENVLMPLKIMGEIHQSDHERAHQLIDELGLSHRLQHKPSEISGGERQRVAIARALVNQPKVILTDEPTGNLDEENEQIVIEMMTKLQKDHRASMIIVTHDIEIAHSMDRVLTLADGVMEIKAITK